MAARTHRTVLAKGPPGRSAVTMVAWKRWIGQVVWARNTLSDPYWPCVVLPIRLLDKEHPVRQCDGATGLQTKKKHLVLFYGETLTSSFGIVRLTNMLPWDAESAEEIRQSLLATPPSLGQRSGLVSDSFRKGKSKTTVRELGCSLKRRLERGLTLAVAAAAMTVEERLDRVRTMLGVKLSSEVSGSEEEEEEAEGAKESAEENEEEDEEADSSDTLEESAAARHTFHSRKKPRVHNHARSIQPPLLTRTPSPPTLMATRLHFTIDSSAAAFDNQPMIAVPPLPITRNDAEVAALKQFYDALSGPGWACNTNWCSDGPLGKWFGVTTHADGRVRYICLINNGLKGAIPDAIAQLSGLQSLIVAHNPLVESFPATIAACGQLTTLDMSNTQLCRFPDGIDRFLSNVEILLSDEDYVRLSGYYRIPGNGQYYKYSTFIDCVLGQITERTDQADGVQHFRSAAARGCAAAQYKYGKWLVEQEETRMVQRGVMCLDFADEQGFAPATVLLGYLNQNGAQGVPVDVESARFFYEKAAAQGHRDAQCFLGDLLRTQGDFNAALTHLKHAAAQGHGMAQKYLTRLHDSTARGQPSQDRVQQPQKQQQNQPRKQTRPSTHQVQDQPDYHRTAAAASRSATPLTQQHSQGTHPSVQSRVSATNRGRDPATRGSTGDASSAQASCSSSSSGCASGWCIT